jgi:hypothetical protein
MINHITTLEKLNDKELPKQNKFYNRFNDVACCNIDYNQA